MAQVCPAGRRCRCAGVDVDVEKGPRRKKAARESAAAIGDQISPTLPVMGNTIPVMY